ncbi:MAG: archease [bacterium]
MYEIIEHTADIGILVEGGELEEFFADAALGMFAIICDSVPEGEAVSHDIILESEDMEGLLVAWLSELLFLFESDGFVPREFRFAELESRVLEAACTGAKTHLPISGTEIKAVTHHLLKVEDTAEGWRAKIYFDL